MIKFDALCKSTLQCRGEKVAMRYFLLHFLTFLLTSCTVFDLLRAADETDRNPIKPNDISSSNGTYIPNNIQEKTMASGGTDGEAIKRTLYVDSI
jgi:hypothetical protein